MDGLVLAGILDELVSYFLVLLLLDLLVDHPL